MTTVQLDPVRSRALMAVLCSIGVVAALEGTLLVPLVSRIPEVYDVSAVTASWVITSTLLAGALATPVLSRLADMYGKRLIVLVTLSGLVVGSLILALTDNFALAIVGRLLQGVAASLVPVGISIIKDVLPAERVGPGIALMGATLGLGSAVGLPLSGFLYTHLGWSSLFWLTTIAGILLAAAVWWLLPESTPSARGSFDWRGALLLALILAPLVLVIGQGNEWGWLSGRVLGLVGVLVVAAIVWLPLELRIAEPLVHVRMLAHRPVALTNVATIVIAMAMMINLFLAWQQLAVPKGPAGGLGLSADATGLLMAIPAGALAAVSPVVGRMLTRFGGRHVLIAGSLFMAAAYVARMLLDDSAAKIVVSAVLVCLGTALALSAQSMIIMESVPPQHTASANGINTLCRMLGTSLSTAALAALTAVSSTRISGVEYPTTATYHAAFWACMVLCLVSSVLIWLVPRAPSVHVAADEVHAVPSVMPGTRDSH